MVQWVGALTVGSVPGLGSKLPQAAQYGKKKKKRSQWIPYQTPRRLGRLFFGKVKGMGGREEIDS